MAKLGMPTVVVKFIEAGIEAIQRSQRGIDVYKRQHLNNLTIRLLLI